MAGLFECAANAGEMERNASVFAAGCLANDAAAVAGNLRDSVHVARVGMVGGDSQCLDHLQTLKTTEEFGV